MVSSHKLLVALDPVLEIDFRTGELLLFQTAMPNIIVYLCSFPIEVF